MMRIGFAYDGKLTLDKSFKANIEGARKAGMPAGIYYYSHDKSEEEVLSSLNDIFTELDGMSLELPIVFDWENFSDFQDYGISFQDLERLYEVFDEEVREHGYQPMLYGSKYYLENVWKHADRHPVWLAHYTDWSSYQGPYQLWQLSAWGSIEGIDGYVDLDILFEE